jgi:hypothetical protein
MKFTEFLKQEGVLEDYIAELSTFTKIDLSNYRNSFFLIYCHLQ